MDGWVEKQWERGLEGNILLRSLQILTLEKVNFEWPFSDLNIFIYAYLMGM